MADETMATAELERRRWWHRKPRHRHSWEYRPRTIGGWGIVRCTTCGAEDIY